MKFAIVTLLALILSSCASTAMPNFYNGNYYMAGDKNCVRVIAVSSTRVMCMDKNGVDTGYRDAMTNEQMQMYQMQSIRQQAYMQELDQSMQQAGQSFKNAGQQITQQSQSYAPPQVQPITPYGSSGVTSYSRAGNTWVGSDGSSCQVVGESILCSDGKKCQIVGGNLLCN